MNQLSNLSITLRQRPVGIPNSDNFSLTSSPVGEIEENLRKFSDLGNSFGRTIK